MSHTAGLGNRSERELFNPMFSDFVNPRLNELFFQLGSIAFHVSPPKVYTVYLSILSIHCLPSLVN